MEPKEFAASILREHEARRAAAAGRWRWQDDPEWSGLVALAAMAVRWDVTPEQFEEKLERLCRTPTGAARPAAARMLALWRDQQAETGLPTILVVEDDEGIQHLFRDILRDRYRVVVATTAREALGAARREAPIAITLDLMLPDGHGARVLGELKADPATARIPVIVTSAYTGGLRGVDRALAASVLHKPFGPIELLEALDEAVGNQGPGLRAMPRPPNPEA